MFDPADPRTFRRATSLSDPSRLGDRAFFAGALSLAALAWLPVAIEHLALVVARLQLGRWPNRMGMDDPKDIPVVSGLLVAWVFSVLAAMAMIPILPCFLGVFGLPRRWRLTLVVAMLAAAVYVGAFAFLRWDPAQAGVWLVD